MFRFVNLRDSLQEPFLVAIIASLMAMITTPTLALSVGVFVGEMGGLLLGDNTLEEVFHCVLAPSKRSWRIAIFWGITLAIPLLGVFIAYMPIKSIMGIGIAAFLQGAVFVTSNLLVDYIYWRKTKLYRP